MQVLLTLLQAHSSLLEMAQINFIMFFVLFQPQDAKGAVSDGDSKTSAASDVKLPSLSLTLVVILLRRFSVFVFSVTTKP